MRKEIEDVKLGTALRQIMPRNFMMLRAIEERERDLFSENDVDSSPIFFEQICLGPE